MIEPEHDNSRFSCLPSIDEVLRSEGLSSDAHGMGSEWKLNAARSAMDRIRERLDSGSGPQLRDDLVADAVAAINDRAANDLRRRLRRVINATGVVIHTNLGRSPLSAEALRAVNEAAGYCTLEFDLATGSRGRRGAYAESLAASMSGAEDALIVNNGAAAAFLVLNTFAKDGNVIVSRGELVEIGGDFRIPDILAASGATLREVGTTNRTHLSDYEKAFDLNTRMILAVHPSNYRIVGFTAKPELAELAELARKLGAIFYNDLGSGAFIDIGLGEPVVSDAILQGADLVTFSGDKLLGGPQAGVIVGKEALIETLRKNPLNRVLRPDKLCYAALEATLAAIARGNATRTIPISRMLTIDVDDLRDRCERLLDRLSSTDRLTATITEAMSAVGGGAGPETPLPSPVLRLTPTQRSVSELMSGLRSADPPVIARIESDAVLIDLRTVDEDDEGHLVAAIAAAV